LKDKTHFIGNAERQIDAVIEKTKPLIEKYKDAADYEPREIL
jgi:hypothetical protein